jgi:hypothetical protein
MRVTRTLTVLSAGLALAAIAGPASALTSPEQNLPEFWQTDTTTCTKVELVDGIGSWVLPALDEGSYALLVIKAGTVSTVVDEPQAGVAYAPADGKDISHVITCVGPGGGGDGDGGGDGGGPLY